MNKPKHTLLLSSAYLPPIEYFAYLHLFPEVIIEQHETFPKQTYRNRCVLYSEKGRMAISFPVTKVYGNHTKTNQIAINNEEKWQLKHWRAIESAYLASPYFLYYKDELKDFYTREYNSLLNYNSELTTALCRVIGIDADFQYSNEYSHQPEHTLDLRNLVHPKQPPTISNFPEYIQVFGDRYGFIPNLSIIDLIFNLGPETKSYLECLVK